MGIRIRNNKDMNMQSPTFQIIQLPHGIGLPLPGQGTKESAGYDLMAAITELLILIPRQRMLIPCGFQMCMSPGFEGQIRSRSGLSLNYGIIVFNAPGTIDADYRGEIKVIMINLGDENFTIERGMRIAQLIISRHETIIWDQVKSFVNNTPRGIQGFGSTGIKETFNNV